MVKERKERDVFQNEDGYWQYFYLGKNSKEFMTEGEASLDLLYSVSWDD